MFNFLGALCSKSVHYKCHVWADIFDLQIKSTNRNTLKIQAQKHTRFHKTAKPMKLKLDQLIAVDGEEERTCRNCDHHHLTSLTPHVFANLNLLCLLNLANYITYSVSNA